MEEEKVNGKITVGEIQTKESTMMEEFAKCVKDIIVEVANGLQKFVYVREEGNPDNPEDAIIMAPFAMVNNLLVDIAKDHGVNGFSSDISGLEKLDE